MVHVTSDPNEQTGTGEPRSTADGPTVPPGQSEQDDVFRPPDGERTEHEINRSGSGGSGGPADGDPSEEGSGSGSMEDLLSGGT
jgi:hypothetical protein